MVVHVLHVIDGLGLGGAERMLVDLANVAVGRGERISVCVTRSDVTRAKDLDPRIKTLVLGRRRRIEPLAYLRLVQHVREERVDVIHVHQRSTFAFLLPLYATGLLRVPILFHDHYGTIESDARVPVPFRIGHRFIAQYVGVYDRLAQWAIGIGLPAGRVTTIPNAIDLQRIRAGTAEGMREELGIAADVPLGILVATLRRDKGIEVTLEAVAQSRHRGRFKLLIAGADGEADYVAVCRAQLQRLGLVDDVKLLGPRTDVPRLLAAVDFALMSSHTESGPLVIIEYLAAGLPIVSTAVGDIGRRVAAHGIPGFVKAGDVRAFRDALDELLDLPPAERRGRGALGPQLLDEHWDIKHVFAKWHALYRGLHQHASHAPAR